ncbi:Plug domain-containing protein, partial [bacterium]|nr:Plug domain-containing protein [bacterium]
MSAYEMESYNVEDLSDILRLFPGMYPQDLGTIGAPLYFCPWGLWPGQMRYTLDGLPLERSYDGLWDPNLLPVLLIDSVAYHSLPTGGLFPGAAGRLDLVTRDVPVDSPCSEIHLREGYYKYGTVDFAHGQRVYKTLSLQLSGQLGWYDGMREQTASRLTQYRAKLSFLPAKNWKVDGIISRAKSHADSELRQPGQTLIRTEGQLAFSMTDSATSAFRPTLRFFLREDKERWGDTWQVRDLSGGALVYSHLKLPGQRLQATGLGKFSKLNLPSDNTQDNHDIELTLADSIDIAGVFGIELGSGARFGKEWDSPAVRYDARGYIPIIKMLTAFAGFQKLEQYPAPLWIQGGYTLERRPLLITPELSNLADSLIGCPLEKETISKVEAGLSAKLSRLNLSLSALKIDTKNRFEPWTSTYSPDASDDSRWGGALEGQLALTGGLSIDTRWSLLFTDENDNYELVENRGFSRINFDRRFYKAPLHIRASLSHLYLGKRIAFSQLGYQDYEPTHLFGIRISARIGGFRLFWGTENIGANHYEYVPGFLMIRKEEYWG